MMVSYAFSTRRLAAGLVADALGGVQYGFDIVLGSSAFGLVFLGIG